MEDIEHNGNVQLELSDVTYVSGPDETNTKIYKFDSTSKDIYDIISYFLEIKSSNDHFYVVDINQIIKQYNLWKRELPFIRPYYAIKSNPDPMIIKILTSLGCGADCASKTEIVNALEYLNPADIIYANPCKEITHIQFARSHDVDLLTFDSETELHKIKINHPKAKLILRIKVDDSSSRCKFGIKFGCEVDNIIPMLNLIKVLELNLIGVSFHVGSGCSSIGSFEKALADARNVFNLSLEKNNQRLTMLDIGGGFPGFDTECGVTFPDIAKEIRESFEKSFGDIKDDIQVIAEPGRFFCTKSHTLVFNIIGIKKKFDKENKKVKFQYTINEGIYGSFSAVMFDYAKPIIKPFNERNEEELYQSTVFGPTCDSLDKITEEAMLPEMAVGDWCFVENFGAYTRASSTSFNGFRPGQVYYIQTYPF
jgi:ornithine decarboxylase